MNQKNAVALRAQKKAEHVGRCKMNTTNSKCMEYMKSHSSLQWVFLNSNRQQNLLSKEYSWINDLLLEIPV